MLVHSNNVLVLTFSYTRLILTMDPKHGEISRAMRNRGVEIFLMGEVCAMQSIEFKNRLAKCEGKNPCFFKNSRRKS